MTTITMTTTTTTIPTRITIKNIIFINIKTN